MCTLKLQCIKITGEDFMKFSIVKRQPSYFFENMHEDLNRFLRDTFDESTFTNIASMPTPQLWRPALEVKETKDMYKIKAELPGMEKKDINVEIEEHQVIIQGETQKCEKKDDENMHFSEFRYGKFHRTIPFEELLDVKHSSAEFKNGILNIELKKVEAPKPEPKKLEIK